MTLTEFLLARIAEDEATATFADGRARVHSLTPHRATWGGDPRDSVAVPSRRMLAECEAKRLVVDLYERAREGGQGPGGYLLKCVEAIAVVYADHPDYDEAWRP